ncbi:MAG TPA: MgtC/SapB family protein [Sedimentisphaerales bacterium]|nr:MgtC/SapB family protein [Sedimentisphaerales bacterium]
MIWPQHLFSIILAVVFGGAIGLEREIRGKPAGLRTNVLICLGAAVFTIMSEHMGEGRSDSLTRIAAQIVTGVGFLGAGAIIVDRGGIHGLTTAATIWLVSSIGMACGAGFYDLAAISTLLAIVVLLGLARLERPLAGYLRKNSPERLSEEQDKTGQEPQSPRTD